MKIKTYTKTGSAHSAKKLENQDRSAVSSGGRYHFAVLADGVSSNIQSSQAAQALCSALMDLAQIQPWIFFQEEKEILQEILVRQARAYIADLSLDDGASCTFAFAGYDARKAEAVCMVLGDCQIFQEDETGREAVFLVKARTRTPQTILSSHAQKNLQIRKFKIEQGRIVLLSDGMAQVYQNHPDLSLYVLSQDAQLDSMVQSADDASIAVMEVEPYA